MAEKRAKKVKIAKYTKEKNAEAWAKYREEQSKIKYSMFNNMLYIIKEAWRGARGLFLVMLIQLVMELAYDLAGTYTDKYIIEFALGTLPRVKLGIICAVLIAAQSVATFFNSSGRMYTSYVGNFSFGSHLYGKLLKKKMDTDYENTEKTKLNDMFHKAVQGAGNIATAALSTMCATILAAAEVLAYGGILSMLDPALIVIIGVPAVAAYYINRHKMMWIWNMADNWQKYDRQLEYITYIGTDSNFSAAKDVRIFGMQRWLESVFKRVFDLRLNWYEQQDKWEFYHRLAEISVGAIGNVAAQIYIVYLVMKGSIGAGDFVLYFNSIFMLSQAVRSWCDKFSAYNWLSQNIFYARDYLDIKDNTNRGEGAPVPEDCNNMQCEIEFRNVSYTYFGAETPTVKNISFKLHKGEKLAMVGLNGAGKTTLIKLMCGLYRPTEGEVLLNGVPLNDYNRDDYFRLFSTVFQDIDVLPVTIAENISGKTAEETDFPRLYDCMKKSGIYGKVMSLPQKENTHLVKTVYDDATDFSGGQMQKLALAKALYKNAPVLLLDEPTAALDPIAEQEMYLNYADFSKGKSSVFISHRLASTRFCDRIILIADGAIAEEGTHSELMKAGGTYAELFNMQSSYYNETEADKNA